MGGGKEKKRKMKAQKCRGGKTEESVQNRGSEEEKKN